MNLQNIFLITRLCFFQRDLNGTGLTGALGDHLYLKRFALIEVT
ncbi:hypothetical protein M086_4284, partial [Bacteroides fragilis str. S13 L11]